MMSWLFFVFCFSPFCRGFLLDSSTPVQPGNLMNEDRYDALLKLFMDERKARMQLQNYVITQQHKIDALISLPDRMGKVENATNKITNFENSAATLSTNFSQLERKYESLQRRQNQLESKLKTSENRTLHLEEELFRLKQVKAINQLQNLANLQQQVQTVQNNINSLTVTSQARGQDMIAMYTDLTVNKQKLVILENDQKQMNVNMSMLVKSFGDNMTLFESSVSALENHNLVVNSTLTDIIEHDRHIGFTAFGKSSGTKSSGSILKFPDIKTSYGLSGLSTFVSSGKFTCEKSGLYLVGVTVMACSNGDSNYDIYKNDVSVMPYFVTQSNVCGSASGTVIILLSVNDTVYVQTKGSSMNVYDLWSSFTILKI